MLPSTDLPATYYKIGMLSMFIVEGIATRWNQRLFICFFLLFCTLASGVSGDAEADSERSELTSKDSIQDQFIVYFPDDLNEVEVGERAAEVARRTGGSVIHTYKNAFNGAFLTGRRQAGLDSFATSMESFATSGDVENVEPVSCCNGYTVDDALFRDLRLVSSVSSIMLFRFRINSLNWNVLNSLNDVWMAVVPIGIGLSCQINYTKFPKVWIALTRYRFH